MLKNILFGEFKQNYSNKLPLANNRLLVCKKVEGLQDCCRYSNDSTTCLRYMWGQALCEVLDLKAQSTRNLDNYCVWNT